MQKKKREELALPMEETLLDKRKDKSPLPQQTSNTRSPFFALLQNNHINFIRRKWLSSRNSKYLLTPRNSHSLPNPVLTQAQQIIQLQHRYNEACEGEKKTRETERRRRAHVIIDRSNTVEKRLSVVGAADERWSEWRIRSNRREHLCNTTQESQLSCVKLKYMFFHWDVRFQQPKGCQAIGLPNNFHPARKPRHANKAIQKWKSSGRVEIYSVRQLIYSMLWFCVHDENCLVNLRTCVYTW